jgi:hypothetical protein
MVVMPTTSDAWMCGEIAELPAIGCFEHFNKHTARVTMLWTV